MNTLVLCALALGIWLVGYAAPVAQERPLPEAQAFLDAVRENLARAERETHLYTYKERRTDIHTNPFGKLGTDGTSLYEVYPSPMRRLVYRRLVEKDGKPVLHAQLAQQDREYRARVAEVRTEAASRSAADQTLLAVEAKGARSRRQRAIDDVVDTLAFQVTGRGMHKGRPAITITFAGKPSARPQTRQGRIAQKFAGTIYVDEAAKEVFYLEARSTDDISYGFGIVARLGQGTVVSLTREPVEGGLWMPTRLSMVGRGRALMVRTLVIDFSIDWFDYERLPAESLAPFVDARVQGQAGTRP